MVTHRSPRWPGRRILARWASLLVILLLGPVAWLWAGGSSSGDIHPKAPAPQLHVAVQQGQLSVDLWEADVEEVLAQIGRKAGLPIIVTASAAEKISMQFTGVALEQGLRRVLRRASRSYAILYTSDLTGGMAMREIRVFGKVHEEGPVPIVAERAVGELMTEASQRFVEALRQHQTIAPPVVREEESSAARRFQDLLERSSEPVPWSTGERESGAVRHLQDILEGATGGELR